MSQKKPLFTVVERTEPNCGREHCDPTENPECWVDVELAPEASRQLLKQLQKAESFIAGFEGDESQPPGSIEKLLTGIRAAITQAKGTQ